MGEGVLERRGGGLWSEVRGAVERRERDCGTKEEGGSRTKGEEAADRKRKGAVERKRRGWGTMRKGERCVGKPG